VSRTVAMVVLGLSVSAGGCARGVGPGGREAVRLRLATTTSTENSGLLEVLLPPFEEAFGVRVDVIAVGTGKALRLAERGDVDVVLVHAPAAEEAFMEAGLGLERRAVMYNDFVVLGPPADPARVAESGSAAAAFARIARARAPFVSRGDESGTHKKEQALWRAASVQPGGPWYLEAGQGMGATLTLADEKQAYTLADRGTYLALRDRLELTVLYQGDPQLLNPYHVIVVNPARNPQVRVREARALARWLTSAQAQGIIAGFRRGGEVLFHPWGEEGGAGLRPGGDPGSEGAAREEVGR